MSSKRFTTRTDYSSRSTCWILSKFLNVTLLISGCYGLYKCTSVILPPSLSVAGHKQFLTNLSLGISLVYNFFTLATAGSNYYVEEFLFPVSLILETVVALVYWPLKIFFTHLIFQKSGDPTKKRGSVLPLHVDLCLHFFPCIGLMICYFFSKREKFQMSKLKTFFACLALGTSYKLFLQYLVDKKNGAKYPYPFLDAEEPLKSVIMYSVTSVAWFVYIIFQKLHPSNALVKKKTKND